MKLRLRVTYAMLSATLLVGACLVPAEPGGGGEGDGGPLEAGVVEGGSFDGGIAPDAFVASDCAAPLDAFGFDDAALGLDAAEDADPGFDASASDADVDATTVDAAIIDAGADVRDGGRDAGPLPNWSCAGYTQYGGQGTQSVSLTASRSGRMALGVHMQGTIDFGNGVSMTSATTTSAFVYQMANCLPRWLKSVAPDSGGAVPVFGAGEVLWIVEAHRNPSGFSMRAYDEFGDEVRGARFDNQGSQTRDVQVSFAESDTQGNIFVVGTYVGTLDLGGGAFPMVLGVSERRSFIAKFDAQGNHLWSRALGAQVGAGAAQHRWTGIATTANRDLLLAGDYVNTDFDFGDAVLGIAPANERTAFVARLSGADGQPVWSSRIPNASGPLLTAPSSGVIFTPGYTTGAQTLGPTTIPAGKPYYAGRSETTGTVQWAWQPGTTVAGNGNSSRVGSAYLVRARPNSGFSVVGSGFYATVTSTGYVDHPILALEGMVYVTSIATYNIGGVIIAGHFDNTMRIAGYERRSGGISDRDGFINRALWSRY